MLTDTSLRTVIVFALLVAWSGAVVPSSTAQSIGLSTKTGLIQVRQTGNRIFRARGRSATRSAASGRSMRARNRTCRRRAAVLGAGSARFFRGGVRGRQPI